MFQHFQAYAGDPIFGLVEQFKRDPRPAKVNLTVGVYLGDDGQLPLMAAVAEAEASLLKAGRCKPYLPMAGAPDYRDAVQALLFGGHAAVREGRVATIQTVGGSGALKVGADVLKRHFPDAAIWVSDPTWDNHRAIFEGSGFQVHGYPYLDTASGGLAFDAMLAAIDALPAQSVVLLHACCHNPTGVDLCCGQWTELARVLARRRLIPLIDMAYQGFGAGLEEDGFALHALADAGLGFFVAHSFSKNFSLYGERCGALSVVCTDPGQAGLVFGQLQIAVRRNYSSPPAHGAAIVARVLGDAILRAGWEAELEQMRSRIRAMRELLQGELERLLPERDFSRFTRQRGMFTFTGLSAAEVDMMREMDGVYLLGNGRMCMAALNQGNVAVVARSLTTSVIACD
jgi:aromatic-amino-acid transaminase